MNTYDTINTGEINRFYPVDFKRELFKVHVNENQLRLRSTLALDFALETAAFLTEADVQWGIIVQTGELYSDLKDVNKSGEGPEIAGVRWNKPSLDQVIHLSDVTSQHAMGLRVSLCGQRDYLLLREIRSGIRRGVCAEPSQLRGPWIAPQVRRG